MVYTFKGNGKDYILARSTLKFDTFGGSGMSGILRLSVATEIAKSVFPCGMCNMLTMGRGKA